MLGILRDGNGKAIQILNNLSIDLDHLQKVEILSPHPWRRNKFRKEKLHLTTGRTRTKTTFRNKSVPKFFCKYSTFIALHLRNENDPTTKLNKLKIDYDVAKEQYINMTQTKRILGKFTKSCRSYNDDSGQDDSLKEVILIINNKSNKIKHLY
jgi:ATP-dependent Clp protease ATP-binding subunit ClpC